MRIITGGRFVPDAILYVVWSEQGLTVSISSGQWSVIGGQGMNTFVIGDIHGQRDQAAGLLRDAGLLDVGERWIGGDKTLMFIGDFFDRGPDGIGTVDLVMRLENEAQASGGKVVALLGNHEVLILSAYHFGDRPTVGYGGTFEADWLRNGGKSTDMQRLTPSHIAWLSQLPAMVLLDDRLFMHADALFYTEYGNSVDAVNGAFRQLMDGRDETAWDKLLAQCSQRFAFTDEDDLERARDMLAMFGGRQIIHGHTPIWKMIDVDAENITHAHVYADGLCVNVDGGMVTGGPGFVYEVV